MSLITQVDIKEFHGIKKVEGEKSRRSEGKLRQKAYGALRKVVELIEKEVLEEYRMSSRGLWRS